MIICEGAGSPAEINLRTGDYANLGLARAKRLPVVVVGDIDRGGVFASLYGTVALLDDDDRQLITAFLINKFRGMSRYCNQAWMSSRGGPACRSRACCRGFPMSGWTRRTRSRWRLGGVRRSSGGLRVAVVRLPRLSNGTDVEALAAESEDVLVTTDAASVADADLVVLPGTRSTVSDLSWLRRTGLAQ